MENLQMQFANWTNSMVMDDNTGISLLKVQKEFHLSSGRQAGTARIGNVDDEWKLPSGMSVAVGDELASIRGNLAIGGNPTRGVLYGDGLLVLNGGDFDAYLSKLIVGEHGSTTNSTVGVLDLRNTGVCEIDAENVLIGTTRDAGVNGRGTVYLPKSTAKAGNVTIGNQPLGTGFGYLELDETDLLITSSLTMRKNSDIVVNVRGTSCGIDLEGTLSMWRDEQGDEEENACITINFINEPATSEHYYGLRWKNGTIAGLQQFVDNGQIQWTSNIGNPTIFDEGDYVYLGFMGGDAKVTELTLSDIATGSTLFTSSDTVRVSVVAEPAEGESIEAYKVEWDVVEPVWVDVTSDSFTFDHYLEGAVFYEGSTITLRVHVRDTAGNTAYRDASIFYEPTPPVISDFAITDLGANQAQISWKTLNVASYSWVVLQPRIAGDTITASSAERRTEHSFTVTLVEDVQYNVYAHSNAVVSGPHVYPDMEWQLYADADQNCKVDLLDLVYVRNRLFETVTPENESADVNDDGFIDLEDLIEVRNNLGAVCEE